MEITSEPEIPPGFPPCGDSLMLPLPSCGQYCTITKNIKSHSFLCNGAITATRRQESVCTVCLSELLNIGSHGNTHTRTHTHACTQRRSTHPQEHIPAFGCDEPRRQLLQLQMLEKRTQESSRLCRALLHLALQ